MPTLKVKQNGKWKNISMNINGSSNNSNSDNSTIIVTYDSTTMLANYSSSEILTYVNDKKVIIIQHEGILYPLSYIEENLATFHISVIEGDIIATISINIDNNKNVTEIEQAGKIVPIPEEDDIGKVLAAGADKLEWIESSSNGGNDSRIYIQAEEPVDARVNSLWIDTDEIIESTYLIGEEATF